ncbi:BCCT family transporter [Salinarimonas sp.]|uniref:BCCT family transporter n=1 Tax=Salinarimonas sp. TaxID=2766526 RepID=UPI0032D8C160
MANLGPGDGREAGSHEHGYVVGQDNIQRRFGPFEVDVHNPVFIISGLVSVLFVVFTLAFQEEAASFFGWLRPTLTSAFDWFFLAAANVFVVVCLVLVVSPYGKVRLGGADAKPDFGLLPWFSMLFAAGMGIGLMFYGVAEPISHYSAAVAPDAGTAASWAPLAGAPNDPAEAMRLSMAASIYHWGLHPWAIYAVLGLALALFAFNRGLPLTVRSIFYPILGKRIWGWPGHVIDILAVFATLFGLATSLGFGAEQASAGIEFLFGVPATEGTKVLLIIGITLVALLSVVLGLEVGVRRLSELNITLAALLMLFMIVMGPTALILTGFVDNLVAYIEYLPALANPVGREDANFAQGWTSFYWAWWISWSPFVGMFIARVSRGRTVREFITCTLLIPSLVTVLWMTALGGTAIDEIVAHGRAFVADAPLELKLFALLEGFPLTAVTSFVGIVLVVVFFVTSSDSGSLVIDSITAGGKTDSPTPQRVFWCLFEGMVAIALLLGGGLVALQAMAVSTGFPFTFVLLGACVALVKGLASERAIQRSLAPKRARA